MTAPKVLVTGARGFIGSHVVDALARRDVAVATLARPVDYHDRQAVSRLLEAETPTVLIHCAWRLAPDGAYLADPANSEEVVASLQLFRLAYGAGCRRIVGVGTCLEYAQTNEAVAETAPLRPRTVYGASKAALFLAGDAWARTADASFAWGRLYFPYGPREPEHRLIPSVVNRLLSGERAETTSGEQRRSFLYAADVGDALAAIALSDVIGAVNVGSPDAVAVRDVVERIAALVGRTDLLAVGALPHREDDPPVLQPRVEKLSSSVKWQPSRDLHEGLRETVAWWRRSRSPRSSGSNSPNSTTKTSAATGSS